MSYYDPEQLPFGVSPFDAQGMESHANFMREMDAALHTSVPAGGAAGAHGAPHYAPSRLSQLIRQLGPGKIKNTKSLAWFIEEKRSKLERTRLDATRGLKRAAVVAWLLAGVLLVAVRCARHWAKPGPSTGAAH